MFGYYVEEFGGPEAMVWTELPDPEPGPGQLLIDIRCSGVNFAETRMRAGTYEGIARPFVLGMECAGTVAAIGEGVEGFAIGDRVCGRARGSHATKVLMGAEHALPMPDNLSFEDAAGIPVGWLTAWHALVTVGQLRMGEKVLIEAVASSVGSAALQIAKAHGCWVAGTASRDDKLQKAGAYGADALYNYKETNYAELAQRDTGGHGIDVGCATIGRETFPTLLDSLAYDGRVLMYGSTGGRIVDVNTNIGERNISILSLSITSSPRYVPESLVTFRERAMPRFADGTFKAVVDTVLPMAELAKGHEMINDRKHFGKVIMSNDL